VGDPEQERAQLLGRILASRHFAHSEVLKRILRYIVDRSPEPDSSALTEYAIAVDAIGRPNSFDPKLDPIVRVSMHSIRQRLDSYFETEGGREVLRLKISKGRYRASYIPNVHSKDDLVEGAGSGGGLGPSVKRFWQPYFDRGYANILIHSEPLFLRDENGIRIRHIRLNNPETAPQKIQEIRPELEGSSLVPYYAYLSVGTVYCVLAVIRMFHEAGVTIEVKSSRSCTWQELRESNLILIGNPGANAYVDALQGGGSFVLHEDFIDNVAPQPGEQTRYGGERYMEGKLARHREYAVITRRPGLAPGCTITVIGAMHGKATEGAGQFVTSEYYLRGLLESVSRHSAEALPDYFQTLLEVDMIDIGDEVVNVQSVTHHVMPSPVAG